MSHDYEVLTPVTVTLEGNSNAWLDTGCIVPHDCWLKVRARGNIDYSDGGVAWSQPEGTYTDQAENHAYDPDNVLTWDDVGIPPSGRVARNLPVSCLVLYVVPDGDPAPGTELEDALYPKRGNVFEPNELQAVSAARYNRVFLRHNDIDEDTPSQNTGSFTVDLIPMDGLGANRWVFKYDKSFDLADQREGGYCQKTGFWAPGHRLVEDESGQRVIDDFADRTDPGRKHMPYRGGIRDD